MPIAMRCIIGNPNARLSQEYGMVARLCQYHHQDPKNGVHYNKKFNLELKTTYRKKFDEMYPDLDFRQIFGRSYL